MTPSHPTINRDRLFAQLEALNAINRQPDGSCCRLALSDADQQGRDLLVYWMKEIGLEVRIDRIGNIVGLQSGAASIAPVMTGSHIDTVATGGPLDGSLGVLAGLEVIRALAEAGVATKRPLAVAAFTNEEGVRFQPDMLGSLMYADGFSLDAALQSAAADGTKLGDELVRIGYAGEAPCGEIRPHSYVELHIEQGPVLDRLGEVLGAVEDLQGISWQEVTVCGVSNHAGTTPMSLRHDAAYCAAKAAVFVHDLAKRMGGSQVATVGSVRLVPNLVNVIARQATFTVDLRNTDETLLRDAESELANFLRDLARDEQVSIDARQLARTEPVRFSDQVLHQIELAAHDLGYSIRRMTSGAGHDAQMMARICPTAMIFVPSVGGISHNPKEHTAPEHIELGTNILLRTLQLLANQ